MKWNLVGSIYGGSSKDCSFCPDPLTNMATIGNSCFWLANFKKSSPLKPPGQMSWNLVGSIYGMSSIKIAHFVPIHQQTWPPQVILVSDWLISKKSSPLKPFGQMNWNLVGSILGRFKINSAHLVPIRLQTWLTQAILVSDWLISKKLSPLKPLGQMNRNLVGSILGRSSIKIAHLILIR